MTTHRRGSLALAGLILFAGGLVAGYSLRGAELTSTPARSDERALGPAGSPSQLAALRADGGAEASTPGGRAASAPESDPDPRGGGARAETLGGETAAARASASAPEPSAGPESSERAAPSDAGVRPRGRLDASAIRDVVRDHRDQLGFCFAWQLHSHPELRGRITMDFTIGEDGSVTRAEVLDDQLGDDTVLRCFRSVTTRMRFPAPEGGEVSVHYPFVLSPDGEQEAE